MIESAERNRVELMIGYRLHFEEANLSAVDLIGSGQLGDVRRFDLAQEIQRPPIDKPRDAQAHGFSS